jgi:hypothetical protein
MNINAVLLHALRSVAQTAEAVKYAGNDATVYQISRPSMQKVRNALALAEQEVQP